MAVGGKAELSSHAVRAHALGHEIMPCDLVEQAFRFQAVFSAESDFSFDELIANGPAIVIKLLSFRGSACKFTGRDNSQKRHEASPHELKRIRHRHLPDIT